jgi:hypothetical protein
MNFNTHLPSRESAINSLAKKYSTLDYFAELSDHLKSIYPDNNFDSYSKYELHKLLNELLFNNYRGEEILKYKLSQRFFGKRNMVAAFEIKVKNSRVDFLTINGQTTSYEIKSELDNFSKLSKQMADYMLAFEYNYLVVDELHIEKAREMIGKSFGLWSYKGNKFRIYKKATLNKQLNPEVQLSLLTKQERLRYFSGQSDIDEILSVNTKDFINQEFKIILKKRYQNRWQFLTAHQKVILPIDVQFFFNNNIKPQHIYF